MTLLPINKPDEGPMGIPYGVSSQPITPQAPFIWGQGGARLTADEAARRQGIASALMQSDYSPVRSVWEGLGRVTDNLKGALMQRNLDKEQAAISADRGSQIAALLGGGDTQGAIAAGLSSPDAAVSGVAKALLGKETRAPYRWESNDGSLMEIGPDGQPRVAYQDPTPKITTIAVDNGDGTKTLVRVGPDGRPIGEGLGGAQPTPQAPAMAVPTAPVGALTPITDDEPMNTVSRDQYNAVVAIKGKAGTDAWLAKNNITVGN